MIEPAIITTPPRVFLAGITRPNSSGLERFFAHTAQTWVTDPIEDDPAAIVEAAGRVCYGSWANKRGQNRAQYLKNSIIKAEHFSVLRHLWFNFLIADLPRSTQLELVRHSVGTAPSFESQRFTSERLRFCLPPLYRGDELATELFSITCRTVAANFATLERIGGFIIDGRGEKMPKTLRRKRVKEAARSVLPNAAGSDGMYSMNAQAVRWVTALRSSEAADQSIRELAFAIFEEAHDAAPALFQDVAVTHLDGQTPVIEFTATE